MRKPYKKEYRTQSSSVLLSVAVFLFLFQLIVLSYVMDYQLAIAQSNISNSIPDNIITRDNTGNPGNMGNSDNNTPTFSGQNTNAQTQVNSPQASNTNQDETNKEGINLDASEIQPLLNESTTEEKTQPIAIKTQQIPPACGQIVTGHVKLVSNLICTSDGLLVGSNDTTIDLNGFSIKGPGLESSKVGIMVAGQNNVTINGNGIITGFQSGLYVSGSNQISSKYINLNNNKVALYITGTRDSEFTNSMINNNTIGVAVHSSNNTNIKYNQLSDNKLSGVTFINTGSSSVNGNNIMNTANGIFMDTQSSFNNIDFNNVFNNVLDINNANNLPININNNLYSNNNCITSLPSGLCIGR